MKSTTPITPQSSPVTLHTPIINPASAYHQPASSQRHPRVGRGPVVSLEPTFSGFRERPEWRRLCRDDNLIGTMT